MAEKDNELHAGFTGSPIVKTGSITEKTRTAVAAVRDEADAVATAAADHPHTTTTLLVTISALAFGVGYVMGQSSANNRGQRFWR
jgi:hypothetical protein